MGLSQFWLLFVRFWVSGYSESFFSSPEAKAVQHPLKDGAAPPDETGAEVSTKQGWPLSLGRLGTPTDENAIKTNSPADRVPSPVSLLITCSKA